MLSINFVFFSSTEQDQECLCCKQGWVEALGCENGQSKAALCRSPRAAPLGQGQRGPSAIGDLSWPFPTLTHSSDCAGQLILSLGSCWRAGAAAGLQN